MKDGVTKGMTIWVTKYALTKGILECVAARDYDASFPKMVTVEWLGGLNDTNYFHGHDWHVFRDNAINRAFNMRNKRIYSLEKQIKKLTQMEFK